MWARGPDPAGTRHLAERLLELVPPLTGARVEESMDLSARPERVAVEVDAHRRPGSVWLDGGRRRVHRLAVDPLLSVSTRGRRTRVRAGERTLEIDCGGFEILAALERAYRDGSGRLFGYLGYELGHELERIGEPLPGTSTCPTCGFACTTPGSRAGPAPGRW